MLRYSTVLFLVPSSMAAAARMHPQQPPITHTASDPLPPRPAPLQLRRLLRRAAHNLGPLPALRDEALTELAVMLWQQVRLGVKPLPFCLALSPAPKPPNCMSIQRGIVATGALSFFWGGPSQRGEKCDSIVGHGPCSIIWKLTFAIHDPCMILRDMGCWE